MATGAELVKQMGAAGAPTDEIQGWVTRERERMVTAGVPLGVIDADFGNPPVDDAPIRKHFRTAFEGIEPEKRADLTFREAFQVGWEHSVVGLLDRQKLPSQAFPDSDRLFDADRITAQLGMLRGDFVTMVAGGFLGAAGGGGIFSAATAAGGAFALPAGIRSVLMEKYENGEIDSFERFWDVLSGAVIEEFKGFTVGAATGAAGALVAPVGIPGVALAAEVVAMTNAAAALEGRIAGPKEYVDAAIIFGGLKGSVATAGKLRGIYTRTGKQPRDTVKDSEVDPSIKEDVLSENHEVPRAYKGEKADPKPEPRVEKVEQKPVEASAPEARVLDRIGKQEPARRTAKETLDKLYTDVVDRLHPLNVARKAMSEGKPLSVVDDAYKLARLQVGVNARANHFLEFSPVEFKTFKRVGRPLRAILEPITKNLDNFRSYLLSKRAVELDGRGIKTGIALEDARGTITKFEKEFESVRVELKQFQDFTLDYLRDAGIISKERFSAMQEANKDFVPFFRVVESDAPGLGGAGKGLKARDPVFGIKGSERQIVDPLESIVKNTYLYISLAERNEIGRAFVDLAAKSKRGSEFATRAKGRVRQIKVTKDDIPGLRESETVFRVDALTPKEGQIAVYRDGKREVWNVDQDSYNVFAASDKASASVLVDYLSVPASFLRAGAILTPEFIARNPARDQLSAFIFSNNGFRPLVDMWSGIFSLAKKDAAFQDWTMSGGPMASLVSIDRNYLQQSVRKVFGGTGLIESTRNVVKSPIEALRIMSEASEQATRIGEFKRATKGKARTRESILQAGFESREVTLDFGRVGARMQQMNRVTAFFNAQVQGTDKMVRSFKDQPARTAARVAGSITIPSVALFLLNRGEEGWDEIPQWQKDLFWLFPVENDKGKNVWYRVPKPFEIGTIFGSGAERVAASILDDDPKAFDDFVDTLIRGSTPSIVPTGLVPVLETFANRSIFLDRPVISRSREKWLPQYQYNAYTTELTKAMGQAISRLPLVGDTRAASPAIIDNAIRGWTGGLGQHILNLADAALRKTGVLPDPVRPADTLADIPIVKAFVVRFPTAGAESISDFYKDYAAQERVILTIRGLARDGESQAAMREFAISQGLFADVRSIQKALSNSSRMVRLVDRNPEISAAEKRQLIDQTYEQMIQMAKAGNLMLEQVRKLK